MIRVGLGGLIPNLSHCGFKESLMNLRFTTQELTVYFCPSNRVSYVLFSNFHDVNVAINLFFIFAVCHVSNLCLRDNGRD